MKTYVLVFCALIAIVGMYVMYAGYCMATGSFWGVAYYSHNYSTFAIGAFMLLASVIVGLYAARDFKGVSFSHDASKSNNLPKGYVIIAIIKVSSIFGMFTGLLLFISSLAREELEFFPMIGFVSSAMAYGFSYIVEAACMYIDKCNQEIKAELKQENTDE